MSSKDTKITGALRLAQFMLLIAAGLSSYLAFQALTGSQVAGCGVEEGCGKVLSSKWSSVLSMPISLPGLFIYLSLFVIIQLKSVTLKKGAFLASLLSMLIIFGALWFTGLQMFIIKSYCAYCCTTHLIASIASFIILFAIYGAQKPSKIDSEEKDIVVPKRNSGSKKQREKRAKQDSKKRTPVSVDTSELAESPAYPKTTIAFPAFLSLLILGASIALQSIAPEKDRSEFLSVSEIDEKGLKLPISDQLLLAPYKAVPKSPSKMSFVGGTILIEPRVIPEISLGKPVKGKDPIHLGYIFDWTCDHCRGLHQRLSDLSLEENPLDLNQHFLISLLPGSYETKSETLHRVLLTAYHSDLMLYKEIELALHEGLIEPDTSAVLEKIKEKYATQAWGNLVERSKNKVDRALEIASSQTALNEQKLELSIFPQLTSLKSVISGVPKDSTLKDFLLNAVEEQNDYLSNPNTGVKKPMFLPGKNTRVTRKIEKNTLPERNESEIQFEATEITAEPIVYGGIAEGTFKFKNTGSDPLTLFNLKTGCGCTYSEGWKQTVEPGETGEFTVNYNSKGKMPFGVHNRYIWVTSSAKNYDTNENMGKRMGNKVCLKVPLCDNLGNLLVRGKDGQPMIKPKDPVTPDTAKEK